MDRNSVLNNKGRVTAVATKSGQVPVNTAKQSSPRAAASISTARPVNTAAPKSKVNDALPKTYYYFKAHSPGNPQYTLQDQGIFDSGCSRHMTGNKSFLTDYQEVDGGFVAFAGSPKRGKITGKGKIRTGKLDFEDVYFVKELKFNIFSVSQMVDQEKTDNNMYSFDLKNVVPSGGETLLEVCLQKLFETDHTCVACQRESTIKLLENQLFTTGNQTNKNAGIKDNVDAVPTQQYILLPLLYDSPQSSKDAVADDAGKKTNEEPAHEGERNGQEKEGGASNKENDQNVQDFRAELDNLLVQQKEGYANSTNKDSTVSHLGAYDDEDVGAEADLNNLEITMNIQAGIEAMQESFLQFKNQKVLTLVDLPKGKRLLDLIGLYRKQEDEREIYAKSAFLYGTIEKEVYVCQPSCFEDPQFPCKVYKVEKALYGLHQAHLRRVGAWYETLSTYFLENRFRRGTIDKTLFIKKDKCDILLVQAYVDDIIFGSIKNSLCVEFEQMMHKKFQMSSMGELTFFIGFKSCRKIDGNCFIARQQTIVANSTTEAEYVAAANCCGQTQKPRKSKRTTEISQSSGPIHLDADETVYKEWEDIMERAATTASSLEAKQDSGNINRTQSMATLNESFPQGTDSGSGPRCQDTILRGVEAQIRFEAASKQSNNPPLSRVNILGINAAQLKLNAAKLKLNAVVRLNLLLPFWTSAKVKTVNGERQIQALVDKKKVIISETSIRSDLKLDDAEGTYCLPTATIFAELERMGAKTTSWNEFSSTMTSAIILLPRFVQVFLDKQVEGMSKHKGVYVTPSHTKKVFANMKRPCKGFSGRVTPLFSTMMVSSTEDMEPTTKKTTPEEHVSTPSYDPPPSGEDRMQLAELMNFCTNLQEKGIEFEKVVEEPIVSVATTTKSIPVSVVEVVTTANAIHLLDQGLRELYFMIRKTMNKLLRGNLVRVLPSKLFENDHTCVACQKGKQPKAFCKTKLVSYCLVVTDDYSRCDNGTEFKNNEMNQFHGMKGIKREFSVARTPQQNGVAERKNRTLIEAARTMIADSLLPTTFWAEAVNTACYVQNRVLVTKPHNKTPYELLLGRLPSISFMRPFGCSVTILNTLDPLDKFDVKADKGFFVGYSINSKAFRDSPQSSKDAVANDAGKKTNEEPAHEGERNGYDNSTNRDSTVSPSVSTARQNFTNTDDLPIDPLIPDLEDTSIFSGAYDDEDVGAEADLNNLENTMNVSHIPTIRIHKDHPKDQIIRDINSATQTRRMTKISEEHVVGI
ncbi:putative ribonuclease H-like domain-containing protein [Tanacetum coccineum]